jgi:lipopolysaccharide export system permease protein
MQLNQYKILDGYILKKYLLTFLLAIALIIIIVITFDVSEKLDDFISNKAPLKAIIFQYYVTFVPNFINLYSPLFIFIAVIFFTSKMAGNTEIIAILSSGISYKRLLQPYLHGSLVIALLVLILGNFVIPVTSRTQIEFDKNYIHKNSLRRNYYSNIHFQSAPGVQVYAESYEVKQKTAHAFWMEFYDEDNNLVRRITAESIKYDSVDNRWEARDYFERNIKGSQESLVHHIVYKTQLGVKPDDFFRANKVILTMKTPELYRHIQTEKLRGSGLVTEAKIEYYQRLLNPLAILVMTFIGVAVSSRKTRGGIGMHLAIGIAIAFTFIIIMKVTSVFAINGNMPPFLAVLTPQIIFGIAAVYLIKVAPK